MARCLQLRRAQSHDLCEATKAWGGSGGLGRARGGQSRAGVGARGQQEGIQAELPGGRVALQPEAKEGHQVPAGQRDARGDAGGHRGVPGQDQRPQQDDDRRLLGGAGGDGPQGRHPEKRPFFPCQYQ
eukprot:scaffold187430_cov38-Prasinocladus_malaysianus.AAC.1